MIDRGNPLLTVSMFNTQAGRMGWAYFFWRSLLIFGEQLVSQGALWMVSMEAFQICPWVEATTWNALRRRKTRSYASFGGRRLSARRTVSFSSGIRSSALDQVFSIPCVQHLATAARTTSTQAFCNPQHRRTSWQGASSNVGAMAV